MDEVIERAAVRVGGVEIPKEDRGVATGDAAEEQLQQPVRFDELFPGSTSKSSLLPISRC